MKNFSAFRFSLMLLFLAGCSNFSEVGKTDNLNDNWKTSISRFRVTPILPLRERLDIGEVYIYTKRPPNYYSDTQIEPTLAYKIDVPESLQEEGLVYWPTYTFSGNQIHLLNATLKPIGLISDIIQRDDRIILQADQTRSKRVETSMICKKLIELLEGENPSKSPNRYDCICNWYYRLDFRGKRNKVYIRIPVEVYYAKQILISIQRKGDTGLELDLNTKKLIENIGVKIYKSEKKEIVMIHNFETPVAFGYRGLLFEIDCSKYEKGQIAVRQIPEDLD